MDEDYEDDKPWDGDIADIEVLTAYFNSVL